MYRGVWYTGAINEEEGERYADGGYAGNAEKLLPEGAAVPADGAISAPCAADLLPGDVGGIAALDRTGLIDYYGGDLSPGVRRFGCDVRFGGSGGGYASARMPQNKTTGGPYESIDLHIT